MEIEVPAQHPRTFSPIKREGRHVLELETVLMTIYYPAALETHSEPPPGRKRNWSRQLWLGRPRLSIAQGFGKFGGVGNLAIPMFLPTMFTKLPAYRNAPLAKHWPPPLDTKKAGRQVKTESGSAPPGEPEEPQFPLLIFSHGLGGSRTMYSSVCGEVCTAGSVSLVVTEIR